VQNLYQETCARSHPLLKPDVIVSPDLLSVSRYMCVSSDLCSMSEPSDVYFTSFSKI